MIYPFFCAMLLVVLTACGTESTLVNEQEKQVADSVETTSREQGVPTQASPVENNERKQPVITNKDIVKLTDNLNVVRRQVVDKIEANGWYESVGTIEPSKEEFEAAIRPIVSPYFTDHFIKKHIMSHMEAFFCYCDAPSPIQGSMKPDFLADITYSPSKVTFYTYRPANEINSGTKFKVTLTKEEEQWKINDWEYLLSSHEQSFQLTLEHILTYYEVKGIDVEHIQTWKEPTNQEEIFVLERADGEWIAIQARDWFTAEGKEYIKQLFQME